MHPRELLTDTTPYLSPRDVLDGITADEAEWRIPGAPHTIAEIVAHMLFWQEWFAGRCDGTSPAMPGSAAPGWVAPAAGSWHTLREHFLAGLDRLVSRGAAGDGERRIEPSIEFPPLAAYTVADVLVHVGVHNAHHLGQVVLLRQLLGAWPPPAGSYTW
jgi:uncharacterized damage-inducible protein DinB